jgi:hypothetical protein
MMIERTLNSEQVNAIVANAPEHARRADWVKVSENATDFAAG